MEKMESHEIKSTPISGMVAQAVMRHIKAGAYIVEILRRYSRVFTVKRILYMPDGATQQVSDAVFCALRPHLWCASSSAIGFVWRAQK